MRSHRLGSHQGNLPLLQLQQHVVSVILLAITLLLAAKEIDGFNGRGSCRRTEGNSVVAPFFLGCTESQQEGKLSPVRHFYQSLNELVDKRILTMNDDDTGAGVDDTDDNSALIEGLPSVVDYDDLMRMAKGGVEDERLCQTRQLLVQEVKRSGGYCLVRFNQASERAAIDGMWGCIEDLFQRKDQDERVEGFHRQTLSRMKNGQDTNNTGSDYVHFPPVDDAASESLLEMAGKKGTDQTREAFKLLTDIGKAISSIVYCSFDDITAGEAYSLMTNMLDDNDMRTCTGCFQRLSRYLQSESSFHEATWSESLRPHCDWSFVTLVPVSSVAGLEVYNIADKTWIRPERVLQRLLAEKSHSLDYKYDSDQRWNSCYVVVMAGKWLEILTNGEIESTIHRVVARNGAKEVPRLSAPVFLRPRPQVSEDAEGLVFSDARDVHGGAMTFMRDFLLQAYS